MPNRNYRLNRYRGGWAIVWDEPDGRRPRHTLGTSDRKEAERSFARLTLEWDKPEHITIRYLWEQYRSDRSGRVIAGNMEFSGKAILPEFGDASPDDVTVEACRAYVIKRRAEGRQNGTIWTEMNHLQVVLNWAWKRKLIAGTVYVERPPKPLPRDRRLTKCEAKRLIDAGTVPHIKLAIHLMVCTAARKGAIVDLTWDRVDLGSGLVHYPLPDDGVRKGRARVPLVDPGLMERLRDARKSALTDHVIEWAGKPVKSVKRAFSTAVTKAGLEDVSPHVLRHTAASLMAEAGVSMPEIAAFLGHTDPRTTARIYARFSPTHLRQAASVLNMSEVPGGSHEPDGRDER